MTDLLNDDAGARRLRRHLARPARGRPARPPGRGDAGPVRLAGRPRPPARPAARDRLARAPARRRVRAPACSRPATRSPACPPTSCRPPSAAHWFGTDQLGRDLYTRVVHGTHLTLEAALVAVGVGLLVGALVGPARRVRRRRCSTTSSCARSTCCCPSRRCCSRSRSSPRSASAPSRSRSPSAWPASPPSRASCAPRCCASGRRCTSRPRTPAAAAGGPSCSATCCPTRRARWWSWPPCSSAPRSWRCPR